MSHQLQIAMIVGSLRRESFNRRLANALAALAPKDLRCCELPIGELPLYNEDNDAAQAPSVKRFKAEIAAADGIIFLTPEYNRSIPGVLKNAIDHGSRPYGQSSWSGKPAGVLGISLGTIGTALAQQHLRNILAYLDVPTLNQPEVFLQVKDDVLQAGGGLGAGTRTFLTGWLNRYADWVKQHQIARRASDAMVN